MIMLAGSAHQMLEVTVLGKTSTDDVDDTRSSASAVGGGRVRKEKEKNILSQISVKNPWSMLK